MEFGVELQLATDDCMPSLLCTVVLIKTNPTARAQKNAVDRCAIFPVILSVKFSAWRGGLKLELEPIEKTDEF